MNLLALASFPLVVATCWMCSFIGSAKLLQVVHIPGLLCIFLNSMANYVFSFSLIYGILADRPCSIFENDPDVVHAGHYECGITAFRSVAAGSACCFLLFSVSTHLM